VELWTHDTDGLTEADFLLAKKIDGVFAGSVR
jgi:pterin-4a-carbinolamine dehydratase